VGGTVGTGGIGLVIAAFGIGGLVGTWCGGSHRLLGLGPTVGPSPAPVVLALNSSAIHLGSALGALLGGLVLDMGAADRLWWVSVVCCGAVLLLQNQITRKGRS
jgi:hypothetical protein